MELEMGLGVSTKSAMSWDMQAEHRLSMPMERESASKWTCSGWHAPVAARARTWSTIIACGCMWMQWAECFWTMVQLCWRTCCCCHVALQLVRPLLAFLIQDLSTCPHCPISLLYGKHLDFGM